MLKKIGYFFLALIILTGGYMATNPVFWGNLFMLMGNMQTASIDESLYDPIEMVAGVEASALPFDQDDRLKAPLDQFMAERGSAALVVWKDGALRYQGYGLGFTADRRSESASMAKTVTALAVLAAVEDGYIESLNDPIGKYFSLWRDTAMADVPILYFMQMRSGIKIHPMFGPPSSPLFQMYMGDDIKGQMTKITMESEPGADFQYNGVNSTALMLMVQEATGQRFADYLSTRIWKRIGATDAKLWLDKEGGDPRGFCCLFATPADWIRLGRMIKNLGDGVLAPTSIQAMTTPSDVYPNYGYQVWLGNTYEPERKYNKGSSAFVPHAEPFVASDLVYLDGAGGQRVYISAEHDMVIMHAGPTNFDWEESELPNAVIRLTKDN